MYHAVVYHTARAPDVEYHHCGTSSAVQLLASAAVLYSMTYHASVTQE